MKIISYNDKFKSPLDRVYYRNPRYYTGPEEGFDFVYTDKQNILNDYIKLGVRKYESPYESTNEEERQERQGKKELSWNELRSIAKDLSGRTVKNRVDAEKILEEFGYGEQRNMAST
jgi:hypothetical protein